MNRARRSLTLALLLAGCATAPGTAPEALEERWRYSGEQRVPTVLQVEGVLAITRQAGDRFEGALDVRRTDALGQAQRQAGLVVGRRAGTTLDFEVALEGDVLRHVGVVAGDTVRGTWIDDGALGGALRSGPFTLVRER